MVHEINHSTRPASAVHPPLCPDGRSALRLEEGEPCAELARPFVLAATILASAMAFIDGSIVTIALPTLQADLAASFSRLQWVVNAYALLLGGLILVGGGAGDRFGRRYVFVSGIVVFAVASFACAAAPSIEILIAARAIQGAGAAFLVPQSLAIIAAAFPREVRGRAIGIWAGASAITTALGPPLGGFFIDTLGWRSVFWINLPLCAAAIMLALRYIPESRDDSAAGALDWSGGLLAIMAFGAMTIGLTMYAENVAAPVTASLLLGAGLVGVGLFILLERRATNPLVPLFLFKDRTFTGANVMTLFLYGTLSAVLFLLPFELVERRGLSATQVGITLLPVGLVIGIFSRRAGAWADRSGVRTPLATGSVLVSLAAAGLAYAAPGLAFGVVVPLLVLSAGMAIVVAPLTTTVMNTVPDRSAGAASGINNAASRLAGLFAVAITGSVASLLFMWGMDPAQMEAESLRFGQLPAAGASNRVILEAAFLRAYSGAMWVAASWGVLATATALLFIRQASGDENEKAARSMTGRPPIGG